MENSITHKEESIKSLLSEVLADFNTLDETNFSNNFTAIQKKFNEALMLQNELNALKSRWNITKNETIFAEKSKIGLSMYVGIINMYGLCKSKR